MKVNADLITIGDLTINPMDYAGQGNAILGIRDSGKTYTATWMAERLRDAGIPFVAFDPIGVWRYLQVGRKGRKGYEVVVAGDGGDLPLTPETAPSIVRAAMRENIPLVLDLYSMHLSKADWKKIVQESVQLLLYENKDHGLRHIFIEEAAEFVPQRVGPDAGRVYAEIEKLARMGRNASLGYTLINQRAEEVNKAVLELCDGLFLHRQKGRLSLTALAKWLDITDTSNAKAIIKSMPTLDQGTCWAWAAGARDPVLIKIPAKNTIHPNPKEAQAGQIKGGLPADLSGFVARMEKALQKQKPKIVERGGQSFKVERTTPARGAGVFFEHEEYVPRKDLAAATQQIETLTGQISNLTSDLDQARTIAADHAAKLLQVQEMLAPDFKRMQAIFDVATPTNGHGPADPGKWQIWLDKLPSGQAKMLRLFIERKRLTPKQLSVLVGQTPKGTANYYRELIRVGLLDWQGDELVLQDV